MEGIAASFETAAARPPQDEAMREKREDLILRSGRRPRLEG